MENVARCLKPKESSLPAKRFVSSNFGGGFDKNKLEKSSIVPKNDGLKKTKFGKIIMLKNLTIPKILKGGPFGPFENPVFCKISKNERGRH